MITQLEIHGANPTNFEDSILDLTGSINIFVNEHAPLVKVRYEGTEQKFNGGSVEIIDNWTYHTFTQSGKLELI